jgi:hypothetical protein
MAVARGGYVEMQSTPHAYYHCAEAEGEDPKRVSLFRTFNPQIRRIAATSGSIGLMTLHLCCTSVKDDRLGEM